MAEADGLDIAPGRGQGEAVILPESTFDPVSFSRYALERQLKERAKRRAEDHAKHLEINKLLSEKDPLSKWDTDNINYFSGEFEKQRNERATTLAKYKGVIPDNEMARFRGDQNKLAQEVALSNEQKVLYDKALAESDKVDGKQRPVYDASSKEGVVIWGDPTNFKDKEIINSQGQKVKVADELARYGNNVFKFRAANKNLLQMESNWDFTDRTGDILAEGRVKPNSVTELAKIGGRRGTQQVQDYTNDQIKEMGTTLYGENPEKFIRQVDKYVLNHMSEADYQKFAKQALIKNGLLDANGNETEAVAALDADQKKQLVDRAISTEGYNTWFRKLHPAQKTGFNEFNNLPKDPNAGKSFRDKYTPTSTPYETGGGIEAFNKKWGANLDPKIQNIKTHTGPGVRNVAIEPNAKGADSESFQLMINGKQLRPVNYIVDDNTNQVWGVFAESIPEVYEDAFGNQKVKYTWKTREYPLDSKIASNVAAQYGFGGKDGVERFKQEALGMGTKQSTPKGKTVPISKVKSLVGKPGYEGYSEKELIDYYKSQGYTIQ